MLDLLFPKNELTYVEPPRMTIGKVLTFKGYNPLGVGQQAVHLGNTAEKKDRLDIIFKIKIEELKSAKLNITFKELIDLYI